MSTPIGNPTSFKHNCQTISLVLKKHEYIEIQCIVFEDSEMENFHLGQQSGYTKYPCFLYHWDRTINTELKKIGLREMPLFKNIKS